MGATKVKVGECSECGGDISLDYDVFESEIIECEECGVELEVTGVNPFTCALAPEVKEDWGE